MAIIQGWLGDPSRVQTYAFPFVVSGDGDRFSAGLLMLLLRVLHRAAESLTQSYGDRPDGVRSTRSEDSASRSSTYGWNRGDGPDGDQDCADDAYSFGVLGCQEVEGVDRVQEPDWGFASNDYRGDFLIVLICRV